MCHICNITISKMNEIDKLINMPINLDALKYGIAILHANIRFLECVLNISYRLEVKKWRVNIKIKFRNLYHYF